MLPPTISVVFYGQDDSFILLSNYSPIWEKMTAFPKSFYVVGFFFPTIVYGTNVMLFCRFCLCQKILHLLTATPWA